MNKLIRSTQAIVYPCIQGTFLLLSTLLFSSGVLAQETMSQFTKNPPLSELSNKTPMVMLTLSADHQVFIKAYNDYDDVNGDGIIDTTYKKDINYIGYFDAKKCYTHASGVFSIGGDADADHYCTGNMWSGNFMNWVSMTRIDIVRLVLYGGYRSTDDTAQTILERSFLPQDAHSFAKYYAGSDIDKLVNKPALKNTCSLTSSKCDGYTFCNTSKPTTSTEKSQKLNPRVSHPLVRIAKGNFSLWASSERFQCMTRDAATDEFVGLGGATGENRPSDDTRLGRNIWAKSPLNADVNDYNVRVEVCGANSDGGDHKCKAYGTNKKPVGLLQENPNVQYGLITKGYNTNKEFGVLRKNISSLADEIDAEGKFYARPINGALYTTPPTADSLIGSLNALRIVDYSYKHVENDVNFHGTYFVETPTITNGNFDYTDADDCRWGATSFVNGDCRNWGNPFSELMAESYRYFAGAAAPKVSPTSDKNLIPGLSVASWNSPTRTGAAADLACVNMNVLGFNATAVSYDGDTLKTATPSSLGIGTSTTTVAALTNTVGSSEVNSSAKYFVGKATTSGTETNGGYCTAKSVTNLADVRGTCPDAPRLEGSYLIAGLAHHVYTNDVLPSVDGTNTISTFGVNLGGALPEIKVRVPGTASRRLTILPACRNAEIGGNCAIVDFKVFNLDETSSATSYTGEYFVSFENSEQGGDYDQDINGLIRYTITKGATNTTITVDTKIVSVSGPDSMVFGFVITGTGTTADTYYAMSTAEDNVISDNCGAAAGCVTATGGWQRKVITLDSDAGNLNAGRFLKTPLYYASKWGSFNKGTDNSKTTPDANEQLGYADVTSPNDLTEKMTNLFSDMLKRAGVGTAAGITAGTLTGEGMMLHSLYHPLFESADKSSTTWVGRLNGLFVDARGRLREDFAPLGELTNADPVVKFVYSATGKNTVFYRYELDDDGNEIANDTVLQLDDLKPIWSARDNLAMTNNTDIVLERVYTNTGRRRYIMAGIDKPNASNALDGMITKNETVAFDTASVDVAANGLVNLLEVADTATAKNIVNYTRGLDITGYRNRTVNWGTGSKVWRLGDIVHSTPAIVGRPNQAYDTMYGDESYARFREKYKYRRQMVYVGANDGMLHAFNAGFVGVKKYTGDPNLQYALTYKETPPVGTAAAHPLGKEMWAYVPYNLLPHLKWLKDPNYSHVFYVDSNVQTFDVNIFGGESATIYPDGWGTIIVVGMRFGGGPYGVTGTNGTARTLRSAYIIMDVTNPEAAPRLLGEITDVDMGFTFGNVELVKKRTHDANGSYTTGATNKWYLVFGSGPQGTEGLSRAVSDKNAYLYSLDLSSLMAANPAPVLGKALAMTDGTKAFIGGMTAKDWDGDYQDDMLYFGVVGDSKSPSTFLGRFLNVNLNFSGSLLRNFGDAGGVRSLLTDAGTNLAFSAAPLPIRDRENNYWVYAGTGRFYVKEDLGLTDANSFFGFKVNNPGYNPADASPQTKWLNTTSYMPVSITKLRNVTNDTISLNLAGDAQIDMSGGAQDQTMDQYLAAVNASSQNLGWYRRLVGTGEANFTETAFTESSLIFNGYIPGVSQCEQVGKTNQYVLDMFTGLASSNLDVPMWALDAQGNPIKPTGTQYKLLASAKSISGLGFGPGILNSRVQNINHLGVTDVTVVEGKAVTPVRSSWREIPLE